MLPEPFAEAQGGKCMNTKWMFLISSVLLCIIPLGAIGQYKYTPNENEELYGTWVNKEYSGSIYYQPQKEVVTADRYDWYHLIPDSVPYEGGTYQIDSKWMDAKGNIWYKILCTPDISEGGYAGLKGRWLIELSNSATVWEATWHLLPADWPKEIERNVWSHNIRYRVAD